MTTLQCSALTTRHSGNHQASRWVRAAPQNKLRRCFAGMDNLSIPTIWSAFPERMEEIRYEMGSVDRELTAVYGLCHYPRQCTSVNARTLLRRLVQRASLPSEQKFDSLKSTIASLLRIKTLKLGACRLFMKGTSVRCAGCTRAYKHLS